MGDSPSRCGDPPNRQFRRSLPSRRTDGRERDHFRRSRRRGERMERSTRKQNVGRVWRVGLHAAACGLASLPFVGCSREHYRVNADKAADEVVSGENNDPRWHQPNFTVYPDARSRFFDPTPPDHPPAPEDDPESNRFMQCVYGMKGYRGWYKHGALSDPQNPNWMEQLPSYTKTTPDGRLLLDLDSAVILA